MRLVKLVAGSMWLMAAAMRPNLGFESGWNADAVWFNAGTGVAYAMIGAWIWSGVRYRSVSR